MSLFGFGSKKEYQRGMADAASAAGSKFSEIDEALGGFQDNVRSGVDQANDNIQSILDILESDEREKLFGLSDEITIKEDLDENQKLFLMSVLYSLAGQMEVVNDVQKKYLRTMYKYLELKDVQAVDIFNVSEVDTKDESKTLFMVVNEFLYLGFNDWKFLEDDDFVEFSESFNLNKRDKQDVIKKIQHKVSVMGVDALILPYETKDFERAGDSETTQSGVAIPDEFVWPYRTERIDFIVGEFSKIFEDNYYEGWYLKDPSEVDLGDLVSDSKEITDAVAVLTSKPGLGLVIRKSGLTMFNQKGQVATLNFDGVKEIYQVDETQRAILLKTYDDKLDFVELPPETEMESLENAGGIRLNDFYTIIHSFVKRGPFYVGDIDNNILKNILGVRREYTRISNASLEEALRSTFSSVNERISGFILGTVGPDYYNEFYDIINGAFRVVDFLTIWKDGIEEKTTGEMIPLENIVQIKAVTKTTKSLFHKEIKTEYHAILQSGSEENIYIPIVSDEITQPNVFANIIMDSVKIVQDYSE